MQRVGGLHKDIMEVLWYAQIVPSTLPRARTIGVDEVKEWKAPLPQLNRVRRFTIEASEVERGAAQNCYGINISSIALQGSLRHCSYREYCSLRFAYTLLTFIVLITDIIPLGQKEYWQIRTDFTTLQLHNYDLKSNSGDYKYKTTEGFTCPGFL